MSDRYDRNTAPEPEVFDQETLTKKIKSMSVMMWVLLFLVSIAIALPPIFGISKPKAVAVVTNNPMMIELQTKVTNQEMLIASLLARTDTTAMTNLRQEFNELKSNDEQRSQDIVELTAAYNRAFLQDVTPKK